MCKAELQFTKSLCVAGRKYSKSMRGIYIGIVTVLVLTAGCVYQGGNLNDDANTWSVERPCESESEDATTNKTITDDVLCAEEQYLKSQLEQADFVNEWGTTATVIEEEVSILNETANGTYVHVRHPYYWGNGKLSSDGASNATYLVTQDRLKRVSSTHNIPSCA